MSSVNSMHQQLPSNRNFGWLFALIFAIASVYASIKLSGYWSALFLTLSLAVASATLIAPDLLKPFNRAWFKLGILLGKIVSPVVLGIIFSC